MSGQRSPLVIVISTLLIAALFSPLRRWLQALIDRRFYRRNYDATQTLARFALVAKDEVELTKLSSELLSALQHRCCDLAFFDDERTQRSLIEDG